MNVSIILALFLIVVGAVIGWRLSVINNKLDWILDTVTDYKKLSEILENELTKDDWLTVTYNGKTYNKEELKEHVEILKGLCQKNPNVKD